MIFSNGLIAAHDWLNAQAIRLQAWTGFSRRGLLLFACACGAFNSALVLLVPHIDDTLNLNFYAFFIFFALFLIVFFFDAVNFSSHVLVVFSAGFLGFVVFNTGGVNSPNIARMPVIPVAALMLTGVRWSLIWLLLIVLLNFVHFAAVGLNATSGLVTPKNFSLEQAILSKLNVLFFWSSQLLCTTGCAMQSCAIWRPVTLTCLTHMLLCDQRKHTEMISSPPLAMNCARR
jgi:hypothetical protein